MVTRFNVGLMRDRELVASIVAGDPAGLAEAYDTYAQAMFAYCQTLLLDPAAAAGAVHDAFVIAASRAGTLHYPDRFGLWLKAVAGAVSRRKAHADGAARARGMVRRQPAVGLPAGLRERTLATATGTDSAAVAYRAALADRQPEFGPNGFPKGWLWDSPFGDAALVAGAVAVAGVAGAVLVLAVLGIGDRHGTLASGFPVGPVFHAASGPGTSPGEPAGGQPGSTPAAGGRGGAQPGQVSAPAGGPTASPSGGVPGSPSPTSTVPGGAPSPSPSPGAPTPTSVPPTGVPPTPAPPTTGPPTPTPSSPSPTGGPTPTPTPVPTRTPTTSPPPAAGTLAVSPGTIAVAPLLGNTLTLTASGGPVSWSIAEPASLIGELILSPSSGTLAAGQSAQVTITVNGLASLDTTLTASPGGEQVTVVIGAL